MTELQGTNEIDALADEMPLDAVHGVTSRLRIKSLLAQGGDTFDRGCGRNMSWRKPEHYFTKATEASVAICRQQ
jgi:hypothetical protein